MNPENLHNPSEPHPMPSLDRLTAALRRTAVLAPLALLLAACGGGGSADAGNTNTYNLDAAISRALRNGVAFTGLSGSLNGVALTMALSYTPQADGAFEGITRRVVRETVTITSGGVSETSIASQFFSTDPYLAHGSIENDGSLVVLTPTGSLPTAARVGDSGPLHEGVVYLNLVKQAVTGTSRMTWSLDADTATTALACLRSVETTKGDPLPVTGAQCFRINTAGDVLGAVVTVTEGNTSVSFR